MLQSTSFYRITCAASIFSCYCPVKWAFFVVRFNDAPTRGYERDVGSKTSLRIVNSQVVGKPKFRFLESGPDNIYSEAPVLAWDPAQYNATVKEW